MVCYEFRSPVYKDEAFKDWVIQKLLYILLYAELILINNSFENLISGGLTLMRWAVYATAYWICKTELTQKKRVNARHPSSYGTM